LFHLKKKMLLEIRVATFSDFSLDLVIFEVVLVIFSVKLNDLFPSLTEPNVNNFQVSFPKKTGAKNGEDLFFYRTHKSCDLTSSSKQHFLFIYSRKHFFDQKIDSKNGEDLFFGDPLFYLNLNISAGFWTKNLSNLENFKILEWQPCLKYLYQFIVLD